jgi:hypothetical protein
MSTTEQERVVSDEGAGGAGGRGGFNAGSFYGEPAPAVFARPSWGGWPSPTRSRTPHPRPPT